MLSKSFTTNIIDYGYLFKSGSWDILPLILNNESLRENLSDIKANVPEKFFRRLITILIQNTLYKSNPEEYEIILDYYEPGLDFKWEHPILHEIAHQLNNSPDLFIYLWKHPQLIGNIEHPDYKDKYGLNAKQRLAQSLYYTIRYMEKIIIKDPLKYEKLINIIHFSKEVLRVKPCKTDRDNWGNIIIPDDDEYLYLG